MRQIKDNGLVELKINGASIVMLLGARRINPGVPSVLMLDCQSYINKIDFQMQSGISYVYDAIKPHIEEVLQKTVTQQLCSALRTQIFGWDEYFRNLNLNFTMYSNTEADLSLTSNPEISDKYADLNLKGQFRVPNVTTLEDFSPAPITFPAKNSNRSCAGISEASINSLVAAYYSSGSLNTMLSNASDSIKITTLNLTDVVPEISKIFKNPTPAKIRLYATSSPKVTLNAKNITMDFQGLFQIHVKPAEGKSQSVIEAKILAVLNGKISISDAKTFRGLIVNASTSLQRLQIDKAEPNNKEPKDATSEKAIQHIFSQMLLPNINEKLEQGMRIPSKILMNPSITSQKGYEQVEMDFIWG
ncbi:BPI fold-containing family C protein-like [Pyxicephalus adspersus]|uniref:BPI fold-containing family C protein-like n=1 Tax=Pyxicephalus adspersus TaxID=30357 RepID=UPI003B5CC013